MSSNEDDPPGTKSLLIVLLEGAIAAVVPSPAHSMGANGPLTRQCRSLEGRERLPT
jgi:hypothetical protein